MVRHSLLVQTRGDDDIVEDSWLTLERPERTTLGQACRDAVKLLPPCQATVGLDRDFEQIIHGWDSTLLTGPVVFERWQADRGIIGITKFANVPRHGYHLLAASSGGRYSGGR
jgi:hypothetical protein